MAAAALFTPRGIGLLRRDRGTPRPRAAVCSHGGSSFACTCAAQDIGRRPLRVLVCQRSPAAVREEVASRAGAGDLCVSCRGAQSGTVETTDIHIAEAQTSGEEGAALYILRRRSVSSAREGRRGADSLQQASAKAGRAGRPRTTSRRHFSRPSRRPTRRRPRRRPPTRRSRRCLSCAPWWPPAPPPPWQRASVRACPSSADVRGTWRGRPS